MFKDNSVLIIPSNIKNDVIENIRKDNNLLNISFITREDFIKKVTFDYTNEAIYYLINKYNIKYEVALVYLNNIYYVEDKKYNSTKLNKLVSIKKDLIENNLLIYDKVYVNYLQNKNIYVYGFDYVDKYFLNILNNFSNVSVIKKEYKKYNIEKIYSFSDKEQEIEYVANNICNLINNNININDIKLVLDNSYYNDVDRIFKLYNIPINLYKTSIYNTYLGNYFINNLDSDITDLLLKIKEVNVDIHNIIVNILNKYTWCDNYNSILEMLTYDFKNTFINNNLVNSIDVINLKNNIIKDNEYVFVLGFNQGIMPSIYKDEDYITDNIKNEVLIETTKDKNIILRENTLNNLFNIKNLIISYVDDESNNLYISNLYDYLNCLIEKESISNYNYSNKNNKIKLTSMLDDLNKYGIINEDLGLLYNNYDVNYKSFDNRYTKINKDNLYQFINNKLLLSYSSLDNYNKCSFRYYLSNILNISLYEDEFMANIGSIFHDVLSHISDDDFDIDICYNQSIQKIGREFNNKEKFFLTKLKSELVFIINTIKKQLSYSNLDKHLYEEKIYTNISGNITVNFMGIVDKILYKEYPDKVIVAIIDYKTGNPNINLNNIVYGLDMQLPIYLYLVKNNNKLKNVKIAGFYLQKILNNEINKDNKHSYLKLKEDNLKLAGYSNSDTNILREFDDSYEDSQVVKSLKVTSKGFSNYSKVLDDDKIEEINKIIDNKIKENANDILECKFDINPKRQDNKIIGCKYCKFMDICFRKEEDIIDIPVVNIEDKGDKDE